MCYAGFENKTSRVEIPSREIGKALLITKRSRTFEIQKRAEKLVNID